MTDPQDPNKPPAFDRKNPEALAPLQPLSPEARANLDTVHREGDLAAVGKELSYRPKDLRDIIARTVAGSHTDLEQAQGDLKQLLALNGEMIRAFDNLRRDASTARQEAEAAALETQLQKDATGVLGTAHNDIGSCLVQGDVAGARVALDRAVELYSAATRPMALDEELFKYMQDGGRLQADLSEWIDNPALRKIGVGAAKRLNDAMRAARARMMNDRRAVERLNKDFSKVSEQYKETVNVLESIVTANAAAFGTAAAEG